MADAVDAADNALSVIGGVALSAGEAALFAAIPWLGLPVISQIVSFILGQFEYQVILQLQKTSNTIIIYVTEEGNASGAKAASDALNEAISSPTATDSQKE